jgi:O-6-methylguanine DNA methyltransferase
MTEHVARGEVESPLGTLRIAVTERGVARLALPRESGRGFAAFLGRAFPDAEPVDWLPWLDKASAQIGEYFGGERTEFDVALDLRGTPFQLRVWRALCQIPFGETRSYAELARAIRSPLAVRAVGAANGANPVPLLVPCHRVIASDGGLGGYGGGLEAKRRLLAFERARLPRGALL